MKAALLTGTHPARAALCAGILLVLAGTPMALAQSVPVAHGSDPSTLEDVQGETPAAIRQAVQAQLEQRLSQHPALLAGRQRIQALEQKRIAAPVYSDPMFTLAIQNDGFSRIQLGSMETSYVSIMASQSLTWPWTQRRALSEAEVEIQLAEQALKRVRLDLTRSVMRALLSAARLDAQNKLLLEQQRLLEALEALASARYQAGGSPQSELLRVRLERSGLQAQALGLRQQQRGMVQALHAVLDVKDALPPPLSQPLSLEVLQQLTGMPDQTEADVSFDAHQRSPEAAILALRFKREDIRLAQISSKRLPAPSVSAGLMVRGALEPMWQLGVGVALPVWVKKRQGPEEQAAQLQRDAYVAEGAALGRTLDLRVHERMLGFERIREGLALLREVRQPLALALVKATLSEYEAGKGDFPAVLDAIQRWRQVEQEAQELAFGEVALRIDAAAVSLEPSEVLGSVGGTLRFQLQSGGRTVGEGDAAGSASGASAGSSSSGMGM